MHVADQMSGQPGSLRRRYLVVASVVAALLILGAAIANWHTQKVSDENTSALKLRVQVSKILSDIRSDIWHADAALNAMLLSPLPGHEETIVDSLGHAQQEVESLISIFEISNAGLAEGVVALHTGLDSLDEKTRFLIEKHSDPDWVYPIFPYVNEKMLLSNTEFESAANVALHDVAEDDGKAYASERYGKFDTVRDQWRYKILNFRALLIRYAGLNEPRSYPQETNIENAHELIEAGLADLQQLRDDGELGLESELAVQKMQRASERWYENWGLVQEFRRSTAWRADLTYMESDIRPLQEEIFGTLIDIENDLLSWSSKNVNAVQHAANVLGSELWMLSGLALIFVILVYILFDRSILRPIAKISNALSVEGELADYSLGLQDSKEIHQLVSAFHTMRKQVHQRQTELQTQALHDALTGLPNRVLLNDRIEQAMKEMKRTNEHMALLLLDLDRFKDINDALGHAVGDKLLQHVGKRLAEVVRDSDTVARLGGDEFAIVAPSTDVDKAMLFAEKIVNAVNDVFTVDAQHLYVGVSVGVAVYPEHGTDVSTLIRHSDVAMYDAKRKRQGMSLYQESQDQDSADKLALVGALHKELVDTQYLRLHYQPQIDLFSREVIAVEALLRWEHPDLGVIPPEHIVQMAEHTGQIDELTDWVIRTAVKDCHDSMPRDKIRFSINLSARNMQNPSLPGRIEDLLDKYDIPHSSLTLEITESAMMSDPVNAREIMKELDGMGINLSVDDYGTGFSSLGYLKLLPVKELKIDKSFVINMLGDENDAIIVHSTIELAHNLGLKVVAEGVESQESLLQLRNLKCDIAQGYFISRPLPKEQFCVWLDNYNTRAMYS